MGTGSDVWKRIAAAMIGAEVTRICSPARKNIIVATTMPSEPRLPIGPSALIVAHPGHELRLHAWLEQTRPLVFVLTDGSGSTRESRLAGTESVLAATDARPAPIFGLYSDRQWYDAILRRDSALFIALAENIAATLVKEQVRVVVADAEEGYNSGHDLCRAVADAAVSLARCASGRDIASFDFLLIGSPETTDGRPAVRLTLDDGALERKLTAARGYPEMASEVESALSRFGAEAFRIECLRRVSPDLTPTSSRDAPFYEHFGEQQVAAGLYTDVIRAREHIAPLIEALHHHAHAGTACSRSLFC